MKDLKKIIREFSKKNVCVIGDLMLDKYIFGKVERVSPEAPVQVVSVASERFVPGGAANAASNVSSLKGNAFLHGVVGNDVAKDIFFDVAKTRLINTKGVVIDGNKPTIQKIRVLGQNQQLLRIDYEDKEYVAGELSKKLFESVKEKNVDVIIVSDYAKGTITKELMGKVMSFAKKGNIPIIVDPKPKHKTFYKGAYVVTPNKNEAEEMCGFDLDSIQNVEKAGKKLMKELSANILITMGKKGMSLFEKGKSPVHIPTLAKEVYDVSGAGDTVIAALSLALSSGASLKEAAMIANSAAGIKVGKVGTAPVSLHELKENL